MATRTGRSKSKRAGTAKRRTTSSKAGANRAGARSEAVKTAAERPAKSAAGAREPRKASSQQQSQQQAKPEGGVYLIFQSSSDNKIYTIPQASFGPAEDQDSKTGKCILGHSDFLRSNPGVVFAALISADQAPMKTCGPSGGGGPH
jgi:hypothetical protein